MSDNCNSTVDAIAGFILLGFIVFGLLLVFPLTPGAVVGWEMAEHYQLSKDHTIMAAVLGAAVNFALFEFLFWVLPAHNTAQKRVLMYLIAIAALLYMNFLLENPYLAMFSYFFSETVLFFADLDRWFVDNGFINGVLIVLYFGVMMLVYGYIKEKAQQLYRRYRKRRTSRTVR